MERDEVRDTFNALDNYLPPGGKKQEKENREIPRKFSGSGTCLRLHLFSLLLFPFEFPIGELLFSSLLSGVNLSSYFLSPIPIFK